jgi:hypothetical protein
MDPATAGRRRRRREDCVDGVNGDVDVDGSNVRDDGLLLFAVMRFVNVRDCDLKQTKKDLSQ